VRPITSITGNHGAGCSLLFDSMWFHRHIFSESFMRFCSHDTRLVDLRGLDRGRTAIPVTGNT